MYGCVHGGIMDQQFFRFSYIRSVLKNNFSTSFGAEPIFFVRTVPSILHIALTMRPVFLLVRTKNLRQSEGLFYQRFLSFSFSSSPDRAALRTLLPRAFSKGLCSRKVQIVSAGCHSPLNSSDTVRPRRRGGNSHGRCHPRWRCRGCGSPCRDRCGRAGSQGCGSA